MPLNIQFSVSATFVSMVRSDRMPAWVIKDYHSDALDLTSPDVYRE
jgi:hypothetical protein